MPRARRHKPIPNAGHPKEATPRTEARRKRGPMEKKGAERKGPAKKPREHPRVVSQKMVKAKDRAQAIAERKPMENRPVEKKGREKRVREKEATGRLAVGRAARRIRVNPRSRVLIPKAVRDLLVGRKMDSQEKVVNEKGISRRVVVRNPGNLETVSVLLRGDRTRSEADSTNLPDRLEAVAEMNG